ncbi:hypothetical protein PG999_001593 [Apiospora kogelbergensis]|uniref:Uncharacterized protein n=1 Tax=Apiospora kogelbergensis TaxID=1337665 RepID=A0AAW0R611_9PEZI
MATVNLIEKQKQRKIDNIFKILIFQNDTTGSARGAAHPERLAYDDNVSNIDNAGSFLCGSH